MAWKFKLYKGNTHTNLTSESFHDEVIYLLHIAIKDFMKWSFLFKTLF